MTTPRSAVKALARFGMHRLGMIQAFLWYRRSSFQILTYHRFTDVPTVDPTEVLTRQCEFIRERFNPVSMSQVEHALHHGGPLPPNALAITVDDGYRDFFSVAFPIFRIYELPLTVYLISGFIDGQLWPWWDRLTWALQHSNKPFLEDEMPSNELPTRLPLGSDAERQAACSQVIALLVKLPNRDRLAFMRRLPEMLAVDIPAAPPEECAAMTWDEVRKLQAEGVEFGAHTHTHPILTSLENQKSVVEEVGESRRRIEEELRSPVTHFCYPNGDFNDNVVAAVKACGFLSATTVLSGYDSRSTDPYLLKRHSLEMDLSDYYFRESLAGLH
ncbi:MAG TPA: polysaccharide deacetylase family protein [Candidatus Bathyarchaeia archaeon]|nr:polysaccharide deacetylase family protein [Candidatus Bathyarchaeia archaeon]